MMNRREVLRTVLEGSPPPYVPWNFSFTRKAQDKLDAHGTRDLNDILRGHILWLDSDIAKFEALHHDLARDAFGDVWDRTRDKDIGVVDELFDDLIEIGLNCFNPFQPEVMDVDALLKQYRGRLTFFGGLSKQKNAALRNAGGCTNGIAPSAGTRPAGKLHFLPRPYRSGRRAARESPGIHRNRCGTIRP